MKREAAPPAGWYPDPEGGVRLRWWDGEDWSSHYRPPPTPSELQRDAAQRAGRAATGAAGTAGTVGSAVAAGASRASMSRADLDEIVTQVRNVTRSEVDRAADVVTRRATTAARELQPLVSDYTNRLLRWIRNVGIVIALLLAAWFVFEAVAQATFFEWLGDRIDALSD